VFFFQAEDGIRDFHVTGVQTCALPILVVTLEALQLLAAVDPLGLFPGLRLVGVDQQPLFMGDGDQIGEVILTLGVAVAYGGQPRSEERRVGGEGRSWGVGGCERKEEAS